MNPGEYAGPSMSPTLLNRGPRWLILLPVIASLAVYANSWRVPFHFDDYESIVENPSIRDLNNWAAVLRPPPEIGVSGRPLLNLSLAINYAISRLDVRSYHAVNIVLHIAAALTLFGVIRRVLTSPRLAERFAPASSWLAAVTATLWAVHPLQTMCVTYVIQRAETMVSLTYLLTTYCFLRGVDGKRRTAWLLVSVLCCAAGMACKESMATAPLWVLLLDRVLFSESFVRVIRQRAMYYMALAATWGLLAWLMVSVPRSESAGFHLAAVSAWQYLRTQPEVILHYLTLVFWPNPLLLDYDWPISHTPWKIVSASAVILIILGWTLRGLIRRAPSALPAVAFFLILAPTSSVVPIIILASEHRMYLPLAAVCSLLVIGLYAILSAGRPIEAGKRLILGVAVAALVVALGILTVERNRAYQSPVALWSENVKHRPDNPRAQLSLGWALSRQGDLAGAIERYRRALTLEPDYYDAMINLGECLLKTGQKNESAELYRRAITRKPEEPVAYAGLANVLVGLGRNDDAASLYRQALEHDPDFVPARTGYGLLLGAQGRAKEAAEHFRRALAVRSEDPSLLLLLGIVLASDSQFEEAIQRFEHVLSLQPDNAAARFRLALCLASANRWAESLVHYRLVLNAEPNNAQVQANYAIALQRAGDPAAATTAYRHAIQADPNLHEARQELAWMLATHPDERVRNGEEAVRLAESLADATHRASFAVLDTLAAAYAEAGRFPDAVLTATKAIELAREAGDTNAMAQIEERQLTYRRGEPYRSGHAHTAETGQWRAPSTSARTGPNAGK